MFKRGNVVPIPNSCFTVLFLNQTLIPVKNESMLDLSLPEEFDQDYKVHGEWKDFTYRLGVVGGEEFEITVKSFATNSERITHFIEGYMGLSPCPDGLQEYSAAQQIARYMNVSAIDHVWWDMNVTDPSGPSQLGGILRINEDTPPAWEGSMNKTTDLTATYSEYLDIASTALAPNPVQKMFFYLDMGDIVLFPKFKNNGIRIYNSKQYENNYGHSCKLNMVLPTMDFETTFTDYYDKYFLQQNCQTNDPQLKVYNAALRRCENTGLSVTGMPAIQLKLTDDRVFEFGSPDYFMYPTSKPGTTQIVSWFGLEIINLGSPDEPVYKKNKHDFYMGLLFVQQYPI